MFSKTIILCWGILFLNQIDHSLSSALPTGTKDDAQSQLRDLNAIVEGYILVAHEQLEDLRFDMLMYRVNSEESSEVSLERVAESNKKEIIELKMLAAEANVDISSCLDEDSLAKMFSAYQKNIMQIISNTEEESNNIFASTQYNVDVFINIVHMLRFELDQCYENDISCISKVTDMISSSESSVPLQIEVEVSSSSKQIDFLQVKTTMDVESKLSDFLLSSSEILSVMESCVNEMV